MTVKEFVDEIIKHGADLDYKLSIMGGVNAHYVFLPPFNSDTGIRISRNNVTTVKDLVEIISEKNANDYIAYSVPYEMNFLQPNIIVSSKYKTVAI